MNTITNVRWNYNKISIRCNYKGWLYKNREYKDKKWFNIKNYLIL